MFAALREKLLGFRRQARAEAGARDSAAGAIGDVGKRIDERKDE